MALATLCFAALDSTGKYLIVKEAVPVAQVTWLRFVGHVVFSAVALWPFAFKPSLRSKRPVVQILRSVLMVVTTGFNFLALRYLQLDQTITIFFLTPLLVAALAGPLLNEWVGWHRVVAIAAGFIGVLLVVHPGIGTVHWSMLLALVATFGYALYNLATRYLAGFDPPEVTQTYTPLGGVLILAPFALAAWHWPDERSAICAARLARLLGRARPLAAHPGASQRAGAGAGAVHLSRPAVGVGRGLSHLRQCADAVDTVGRRRGDPFGSLPASPGSGRRWARPRAVRPRTSPRNNFRFVQPSAPSSVVLARWEAGACNLPRRPCC